MESKKRLTVALIIAVTLAGSWFLWQKNSTPEPGYREPAQLPGNGLIGTNEDDPYDVLITFTDEGYAPRDVTVAVGARVRFFNASHQETWPASAIHPTHSLYPGKESTDCLGSAFDACRGLKPGEYWAFTFNYEGEWRYHDHLDATKAGSVTVAPK